MKKKSITRYYIIVAILSVLVMSCGGGTSSKKSKNQQITITTEVEVGTLFSFYFERSANDTAAIWVDLNNDKVQDEGELIYPDELTEFKGILDASTFTIYGDISYINLNVKKITDLDISKCPNLKEIRATSNKLTSIDLTKNLQLTDLQIANNELTELDLSNNAELKELWIDSNKIKTIKAKKFNQLRRIICQDNEISAKSMIELFKAVQHVEKPGGAVAEVSYDTEEDLNEVPQEAVDIAKSKNWRLIKTTREGEIEY